MSYAHGGTNNKSLTFPALSEERDKTVCRLAARMIEKHADALWQLWVLKQGFHLYLSRVVVCSSETFRVVRRYLHLNTE